MKEIKVNTLVKDISEDTVTITRILKEKLYLVLNDTVALTSEFNAKQAIEKFKADKKRYLELEKLVSGAELNTLYPNIKQYLGLTAKQINTINTKDVFEYGVYVEYRHIYDGGKTHKFITLESAEYFIKSLVDSVDLSLTDENGNTVSEKSFDY